MLEIIKTADLSDHQERQNIWYHTTTTVAFLTSTYKEQEDVMACEWAIQCRKNPPQFLVVVGKKKLTAELINKSGEFGLTFIADDQAHLSHYSGSYSGYDEDKINSNKFHLRKGNLIKAPIILDGLLEVECKLNQTIDNDERFIFIGDVLFAKYRDDKEPLIYHNKKYYKLGENVPKTLH